MRAKKEAANTVMVKPGRKLDAKHHANYAKAVANPIMVKGGLNNRSDILHDSRFLLGAAAPAHQLWPQARIVWGQDGVERKSARRCSCCPTWSTPGPE